MQTKKFVKSISNSQISLSFSLIWNWNDKYFYTIRSSLKTDSYPIPDQLKWAKCIPVFRSKRRKNPTRWGGTYLYGLYKGVPPGCETNIALCDDRMKIDKYRSLFSVLKMTVSGFEFEYHLSQYLWQKTIVYYLNYSSFLWKKRQSCFKTISGAPLWVGKRIRHSHTIVIAEPLVGQEKEISSWPKVKTTMTQPDQ